MNMEPMTLDSPVGSPMSSPVSGPITSNPGFSSLVVSSNSYIPSYLMGDNNLMMTTRVPSGSTSPGRPSLQYNAVNAIHSPGSPQQSRDSFFNNNRLGGERTVGPPTQGLPGGLPQSPSTRITSMPFLDQHRYLAQTTGSGQNIQGTPVGHSSSPYPNKDLFITNIDPSLESQANSILKEPWVTVFGFPAASASYILTQFAHLGTIVEQRHIGSGNWMHLKYQTKLQARKALSKNAKVFNGNIMVGVVPCTDKAVISCTETPNLNLSSVFSPKEGDVTPTTPKSHIRPLTQAYQASRADIEVTPSANTPKKNDSIVSRAIQHILGV